FQHLCGRFVPLLRGFGRHAGAFAVASCLLLRRLDDDAYLARQGVDLDPLAPGGTRGAHRTRKLAEAEAIFGARFFGRKATAVHGRKPPRNLATNTPRASKRRVGRLPWFVSGRPWAARRG